MNKITILWVDDEIDLLKPHILFLEGKNYAVVTCTSGQEALEEIQKTTVDIIFLDEISWMGAQDSDFAGKLKGIWDTKLKKNNQVTLILCGSVTAWIERAISISF